MISVPVTSEAYITAAPPMIEEPVTTEAYATVSYKNRQVRTNDSVLLGN